MYGCIPSAQSPLIIILIFSAEQFSICVKNRAENDTELTQDSVTPDESSQTQHGMLGTIA